MNDIDNFPLVSIAIITYNQKLFLKECIESCLEQDYLNFEIVVADDGSTDGTHEMLNEYKNQFPDKFILHISSTNEGITANCNVAHFACNGKYIAWMGGDDLMLPGKIMKQVMYMENNLDCTICYHDLDVFDDATGKTLYLYSENNVPREGGAESVIRYGTFNGACSNMVRKDKVPKSGFDIYLPVASDLFYWFETLNNGGEIRYINEILGRYRMHNSNITNNKNSVGISQNVLDHFNTCNLIMIKYPNFFNQASNLLALNLKVNRFKLPYFKTLFLSFRIKPELKTFFGLFVFFITFGSVKL